MNTYIANTLVVALLLAPLSTSPASAREVVEITKIYDGDTVTLSDGSRIRLIQIDAPELGENKCYAQESRLALVNLLKSKRVTFIYDETLDQKDRYGRKLGYLFVGKVNVNLKMIELGAAAPYFFRGSKGKFATEFERAAKIAKSAAKGLWGKCKGTELNPLSAVQTVRVKIDSNIGSCDPNYAGCVPISPPDLDCSDIRRLGLAPVKIVGVDSHRLDQDGDGYGCE